MISHTRISHNAVLVVDLDGTLCNDKHRIHLADAKQWDEYHALLDQDGPNPAVEWLVHLTRKARVSVIACTARPERYRAPTLAWLMKHRILVDDVIMRPEGDYRPAPALKPELLQRWHAENPTSFPLTAQERIIACLEDRDDVAEALRNAGFTCWQVQ